MKRDEALKDYLENISKMKAEKELKAKEKECSLKIIELKEKIPEAAIRALLSQSPGYITVLSTNGEYFIRFETKEYALLALKGTNYIEFNGFKLSDKQQLKFKLVE